MNRIIYENQGHLFDLNGTTIREFDPNKSKFGTFLALIGKLNLNDGVQEYLKNLENQEKKTALVTSAKSKHLKMFPHIEFETIFGPVITGEKFGDKREQYLHALELLKLNPHEAVAYEDSLEGVEAVKGIDKLKLCVVHNPIITSKDRAEIDKHADYQIRKFNELIKL